MNFNGRVHAYILGNTHNAVNKSYSNLSQFLELEGFSSSQNSSKSLKNPSAVYSCAAGYVWKYNVQFIKLEITPRLCVNFSCMLITMANNRFKIFTKGVTVKYWEEFTPNNTLLIFSERYCFDDNFHNYLPLK